MAILMPSMMKLREAARQISCANNLHQLAIATSLYTDDYNDRLYPTYYNGVKFNGRWMRDPKPGEMLFIHRGKKRYDNWDGLGHLLGDGYLTSPEVFYCPSHTGEHSYNKYSDAFASPGDSKIASNYHYRGSVNQINLSTWALSTLRNLEPDIPILTDGLRTKSDFSHTKGCNVLQADLSVFWYRDPMMRIYKILPQFPSDQGGDIYKAWGELDGDDSIFQ